MTKHICPDCGASHEMDAEGRIARLEERVKELEARQPCTIPHYYYPVTIPYQPTWTWTTSGTANSPDLGTTVYVSGLELT